MIQADKDAKRLLEDLLNNYDNIIRPINHSDEYVTLYLGIKLSQIADIVI
jgi:hypothetical protein